MNDTATATFEQERGRLTSLAYRMLGERAAAEDVVQNAWLRWAGTDEREIKIPAAWLTTVTTRLAIDALKSARHKREVYAGIWLPEPILSDTENPATPEDALAQAQDVQLALLWAMERLAPEERAAFILREAFDSDYADIAATLDKTEAACRQLVARAKKRVSEESPRFDASIAEVGDLLSRFMEAAQTHNKQEILSLLSPDALALSDGGGKVRAAYRPLVGPDDIALVFTSLLQKNADNVKPRLVYANGRPAIVSLQKDEKTDIVISLVPDHEGLVRWIYVMRNPDKLTRPTEDIRPSA
ncbi:MAG: RNA polymerase sigma factor SigJ [Rhodobiaceae bacterium]|nr:ECF RNA polymerase sigma factor SigJ [Rhodobiaceae bacterium]MCR9242372.1 RNA polymerase sigma factor SigJ [Rhodobiaceae bacterium]